MNASSDLEKQVLVCQHRTCTKDGSAKVLAALQAADIPEFKVSGCGCLGLCGSGPIVLVLPEGIYYWRVKPKEVTRIIEEHLRNNQPIRDMMHPRLHQFF